MSLSYRCFQCDNRVAKEDYELCDCCLPNDHDKCQMQSCLDCRLKFKRWHEQWLKEFYGPKPPSDSDSEEEESTVVVVRRIR